VSFDPDYELIARVWRDSSSGSDDSVYVEIIEGEIQLTMMIDTSMLYIKLSPERVKDLRNALARAEKRLS
jgi:hypothetical protein